MKFLLTISSIFLCLVSFSQINWKLVEIPDTVNILSIYCGSDDAVYLGGFSNIDSLDGMYKSFDDGQSWELVGQTNTIVYEIVENVLGELYIGTSNALYKSADGGENWEYILGTGISKVLEIELIGTDTLFIGGNGIVLRSFDAGSTWDTTFMYEDEELITGICRTNNDELFIGVQSYLSDTGGVWKSVDWGESWFEMLNVSVTDITLNSNDELFASTMYNGLYRSVDFGETWQNIGQEVFYCFSLVVNLDDIIYAGCHDYFNTGGVYESRDNGDTWIFQDSGLTCLYIEELSLNQNGFLYAASHGNWVGGSLFKSQYTTVYVEENIHNTTNISILPNPFSFETTISYSTKSPGLNEISIYNMHGHKVKTLLNKSLPSGNHEISWDGKDDQGNELPTGLYIIHLKVNGKKVGTYRIIKS